MRFDRAQIADSFRSFGLTASTTSLLAVKVGHVGSASVTAESVERHLEANVKGERIEFDDEGLAGMSDLGRIRKIYKLNAPDGGGKGKKKGGEVNGVNGDEERDERAEMESVVLGLMALRGS